MVERRREEMEKMNDKGNRNAKKIQVPVERVMLMSAGSVSRTVCTCPMAFSNVTLKTYSPLQVLELQKSVICLYSEDIYV